MPQNVDRKSRYPALTVAKSFGMINYVMLQICVYDINDRVLIPGL